MKRILFILALFFSVAAAAQQTQYLGTNDNIVKVRNDLYVDSVIKLPPDTLASAPIGSLARKGDNVYLKKSTGFWGFFQALSTGGLAYQATTLGIGTSGDETSDINTALGLSAISEIIFDVGDYTVSGTVTIPAGKRLTFKNGARLIGSGTINGGFISADYDRAVFGTSLTVTNLSNSTIPVTWFGATANGISFDNWAIFNKAFAAAKQFTVNSSFYKWAGNIYVPRAEKTYYLSRPLVIEHIANFSGDAFFESRLEFPVDSAGVKFKYNNVARGTAWRTYMHDLAILGSNNGNVIESSIGVLVNSLGFLERVYVRGFASDGIKVHGTVEAGDPADYTNANNGSLTHCKSELNLGHGLHVRGSDGNVISVYHFDGGTNQKYGIYDRSFLGNTYINCHTEDNGFTSTRGRIRHGGVNYWCKRDALGIEPGVTANWQNYWAVNTLVGFGDEYFTPYPYDNAKQYYGNGAFASIDANARTLFLNCYAEGNQGGVLMEGSSTMVIGGLMAVMDYGASDVGDNSILSMQPYGNDRAFSVRNLLVQSPTTNRVTLFNKLSGGMIVKTIGATYGFNMGEWKNDEKLYVFGSATAGNSMGLSFLDETNTTTWGRPSAIAASYPFIPIFYNGLLIKNFYPGTHAIHLKASRLDEGAIWAGGSNNSFGDIFFNAESTTNRKYFAWRQYDMGAVAVDTVFTQGYVPQYPTGSIPSATFAPQIVYDNTLNLFKGINNAGAANVFGDVADGENVGTGSGLFKQKSAGKLQFYKLLAPTDKGLTLTGVSDDIQIVDNVWNIKGKVSGNVADNLSLDVKTITPGANVSGVITVAFHVKLTTGAGSVNGEKKIAFETNGSGTVTIVGTVTTMADQSNVISVTWAVTASGTGIVLNIAGLEDTSLDYKFDYFGSWTVPAT